MDFETEEVDWVHRETLDQIWSAYQDIGLMVGIALILAMVLQFHGVFP